MTNTRRARRTVERPSVAIAYLRVSTGRQAESGLSLEQQERQLRHAAEVAGYAEVLIVREEGVSGKAIRNRPALLGALDLLATGQAAALLVAKMDRLSRSTRDTLHLCDLADKQGWRLMSLDLNLDTGTPTGRLVLTLLAAVAEMERARIGERHRDWHAAKRERGLVWGVDEGPRSQTPEGVRRRVQDERAQGVSLQRIADGLNADGVPTTRGGAKWHASTVSALLASPSLRGVAS